MQEQYTGAEKRAALEICVVRDSLESLGGKARWVPHEQNPVDCMTKIQGNAVRMLELMKTHKYKLIQTLWIICFTFETSCFFCNMRA